VQQYESGVNRIGAGRLYQIEGTAAEAGLADSAGLRLAAAFPKIADRELRRRIVRLVEELAGGRRPCGSEDLMRLVEVGIVEQK
jgi:hypothetical protein